jgi:hypothetical protein
VKPGKAKLDFFKNVETDMLKNCQDKILKLSAAEKLGTSELKSFTGSLGILSRGIGGDNEDLCSEINEKIRNIAELNALLGDINAPEFDYDYSAKEKEGFMCIKNDFLTKKYTDIDGWLSEVSYFSESVEPSHKSKEATVKERSKDSSLINIVPAEPTPVKIVETPGLPLTPDQKVSSKSELLEEEKVASKDSNISSKQDSDSGSQEGDAESNVSEDADPEAGSKDKDSKEPKKKPSKKKVFRVAKKEKKKSDNVNLGNPEYDPKKLGKNRVSLVGPVTKVVGHKKDKKSKDTKAEPAAIDFSKIKSKLDAKGGEIKRKEVVNPKKVARKKKKDSDEESSMSGEGVPYREDGLDLGFDRRFVKPAKQAAVPVKAEAPTFAEGMMDSATEAKFHGMRNFVKQPTEMDIDFGDPDSLGESRVREMNEALAIINQPSKEDSIMPEEPLAESESENIPTPPEDSLDQQLDEFDKVFDSLPPVTFPELSNRSLAVPKPPEVRRQSKRRTGVRKTEKKSSAAGRFLENA